jgi:ubiquinone/menaquinone biosynthesis C-methylase UbiE
MNENKTSVNYRFWHEYYPSAKKEFIKSLPIEVRKFHVQETKEMKKLIKAGRRYLFVGCGDGREVEPLKNRKIKVCGIDYVKGVVDEFNSKFKNYSNFTAKLAYAQNLPFQNDFFDGAFLLYNNLGVLGDKIKLLKEIYRVIRKNAFLFGTVYNENARVIQINSYKGLNMKYLKHDDKSVTVITSNGITYTSERFSRKELERLFKKIDVEVKISSLTKYSYMYTMIKI